MNAYSAAGGFGDVYLGVLNRENVAFKVVKSHSDKQHERFLQEIMTLRACTHTHIVQVISVKNNPSKETL